MFFLFGRDFDLLKMLKDFKALFCRLRIFFLLQPIKKCLCYNTDQLLTQVYIYLNEGSLTKHIYLKRYIFYIQSSCNNIYNDDMI